MSLLVVLPVAVSILEGFFLENDIRNSKLILVPGIVSGTEYDAHHILYSEQENKCIIVRMKKANKIDPVSNNPTVIVRM
jgi:hypothetical protein